MPSPQFDILLQRLRALTDQEHFPVVEGLSFLGHTLSTCKTFYLLELSGVITAKTLARLSRSGNISSMFDEIRIAHNAVLRDVIMRVKIPAKATISGGYLLNYSIAGHETLDAYSINMMFMLPVKDSK